MDIDERKIPVRDLVEDYHDDAEGGVTAHGGLLDVRPPFQREFVYRDAQRDAVIATVEAGYPLNTMYWADRGAVDGARYEVIDGQQRTISVCQYVTGVFSRDGLGFDNLPADRRRAILDYEMTVYVCSGTESEKLAWFEVVNVAGEPLTDQELLNAVYAGPWLADAKRHFSRPGCQAANIAGGYLRGSPIRQDYLRTAIRWAADGSDVREYMAAHQHDPSARKLWLHFLVVVEWVAATFTEYRPAMKGVDWGALHAAHGDDDLDPAAVEAETARLVGDSEVRRQSGIYAYILTGDERHLNLRTFPKDVCQRVYERQEGECAGCYEEFLIGRMEADHITPWSEGGRTVEENCQMLCRDCNRRKGAR